MAGSSMDAERWKQVEGILDQALELGEGEVAPFLDRACDDPQLRAEVEGLLDAEGRAGRFLDIPAGQRAAGLVDEFRDSTEVARPLVTGPPIFEGRQLGHYQVLRRIGSGGMGVVYEARDPRLERTVALKVLPEKWSWNKQIKQRFLREARTASNLDHPNICAVHDLGESDGRLFIVMPYYRGETLREKIDRGPLPAQEAREWIIQVARGLEQAHRAGVVHRDIKPANIMMTDGDDTSTGPTAKILDFGIARVADDTALTRTGQSPGTPAYMSPEQARGDAVDARSDIWSLGVMLHEMLTGQRPPRGQVFPSPAVPLPADLLPEDLARVVARALADDPGRRYPSVRELLADLDASPAVGLNSVFTARVLAVLLTTVLLTAILLTAALTAYRPARAPSAEKAATTVADSVPTSLAVLFFQNLTGDPELDWLRSGLTEILVTDLSRASAFKVLSTGRLHQALDKLDALELPHLSLELTQELAEVADVDAVVRGSYAKLGDVIRIVYQVEVASTGATLVSSQVEGRGTESLFGLIDELSATVRHNFEGPAQGPGPVAIAAVTTSSPEAWRLYSAGIDLQHRSLYREAVALLEKSVEIDSGFALALAALGQLHRNLGHASEAGMYLREAAKHADRLPVDQRLSVQGTYYGNSWQTYDLGIEALEEAVGLYPGREALRNNLAALYGFVERYEEAAMEYGALVRGGTSFSGTAVAAASVNAGLGRFETGFQTLSDFASRYPDDWYVHFGLGWLLTEWGRFDQAAVSLATAASLRPGEFDIHHAEWRLRVLRQEWSRAEREAAAMEGLRDAHARWRGAVARSQNLLYRGEWRLALEALTDSIQAYSEPNSYRALSHCLTARRLLEKGDAEGALRSALLAQEEGRGQWPELQGFFLATLALEKLGRGDEAAVSEQALKDRVAPERAGLGSNVVEERLLHHLTGLLALERGEAKRAVAALGQAAALLPPRGIEFHRTAQPDHVPIWYALGRAEWAAGRPEQALGWFQKVVTSGVERLHFPVLYVRGCQFLGKIHQERGESEQAQQYFERVLEHWEDGGL